MIKLPTNGRSVPPAHEVLSALREYAVYWPEAGHFIRRRTTAVNAKAGEICGAFSGSGYRYIRFGALAFKANRLAWLWMTGEWPPGLVDHRNGDRGDDRWSNLRLATYQDNNANAKRRADNTSGLKGVKKIGGRWQARIGAGGSTHLGTFDTPEEAHAEYCKAATALYGEFARAE